MSNNTILITGGTGLLGSQFIDHFHKKGFTVIYTSRSGGSLAQKHQLYGIQVNLERSNSSDVIINYLLKNNLWPESLVNNAINLTHQKINLLTKMVKRREFLGEYLLDVVVPYELSYKLAIHKKSALKRIVNISSMYGIVARNPNLYLNPDKESPIQYGLAKAALIHLTKELAVRLAPKIQVNCISYGGIEGRVNEDFKKRYAKFSPLGRMFKKEEVTGALDFLISDNSVGITGHNLIVDGGWTIW